MRPERQVHRHHLSVHAIMILSYQTRRSESVKSGLINIEDEKAIARHEIKLKLDELFEAACVIVRDKGRFCIIYHPADFGELIVTMKKKGTGTKETEICSFSYFIGGENGFARGGKRRKNRIEG